MAGDRADYRSFLLRLACRCAPCVAPVVVHHNTFGAVHASDRPLPPKALGGKRGKGQRASDWFGMPLCPRHHDQLHNPAKRGHFFGWSGEQIVAWQDEQVAAMHGLYEEEIARNPGTPLALMQSRPWVPPAYKARERRERKRQRKGRKLGGAEAVEAFQREAPNAFADLGEVTEQLDLDRGVGVGAVEIARREHAAGVEWWRKRAGERRSAPEVFQELSDLLAEFESIDEPLSMRQSHRRSHADQSRASE
jgi:hypothetical protein